MKALPLSVKDRARFGLSEMWSRKVAVKVLSNQPCMAAELPNDEHGLIQLHSLCLDSPFGSSFRH
jgi:hypothetical protein